MNGIFWEWNQNRAISEASLKATEAQHRTELTGDKLEVLERKVEKLKMLNMALLEILGERFQLQEADVIRKVQEIDLRDGKKDGQLDMGQSDCEDCGRTYSRRNNRCLYCGHVNVGQSDILNRI